MTNKEPELSPKSAATCSHWHLLHSISLKGDTGANQSSEPPPVAPCTDRPRDLSSAGGLCPGLSSLPTPSYNIASQLSGMFLAPLPPYTCHNTGKLSQAGPLRRLLNQAAHTRSQITITLSNHPHPRCPV